MPQVERRKGKKRLSVDVPKEVYETVRALAYHQDVTVTTIVLKSLAEYMNSQKKYWKQ